MTAPARAQAARTCVLVAASCFVCLIFSTAFAQLDRPVLPDHWFQERGPAFDGDAISFCVDPRDPGHVVDAAIAEAIADVLLTNVRLHVVAGSQFMQEDYDDLYFELVEHCALYVGFRLYADTYPDWLAVTRGFYTSRFVLLTQEAGWRTLDDIPQNVPIGVVQGTLGDVRFLLANNAQPPAQRRQRLPLGQPGLALDALMAGRVGALLVWEPWWWWLSQERPELAGLHVVDVPFVSDPPTEVGAVLLTDRMAVRIAVDEAIAALTADGTIQGILERFGYPGTVR